MAVGDYARSFTDETRELRRPLSNVFRRLWMITPEPVNNGQNNTCQNKNPDEFIAENFADLMFLRLPTPGGRAGNADRSIWREEWLRGGNDFGTTSRPRETASWGCRSKLNLNICG